MKECLKVFYVDIIKPIEVTARYKKFRSIKEYQEDSCVVVEIAYYDEYGKYVSNELHTLIGEYYNLLMSENPDWAPGKPKNEYREDDLFDVIEKMTSEKVGD